MEADVVSAFDSINKRLSHQESIHKSMTFNPTMFINTVIEHKTTILIVVAISTIATILILNKYASPKKLKVVKN